MHFPKSLVLFTITWRDNVDIILLLGIVLLVLALLGFSGVIAALESIAVVLLIIAVLVLLFLFRDQLGFGGDRTEVTIPDKIDVNIN